MFDPFDLGTVSEAIDNSPPAVLQVFVDSSTANSNEFWPDGYAIPDGSAQFTPLSWNGLDQVGVRFDEDVIVLEEHLTLQGGASSPTVTGFQYDENTQTAVWEFSEPFVTDRFLLTLSDDIRDHAGNALDGEWRDGVSVGASGNGIAGDSFTFRFDVQVGDVNGDGETDGRDHGAVSRAITEGLTSNEYDINLDGEVSEIDLDLLSDAIGETRPELAPDATLHVVSVSDRNSDGNDELVVLRSHPTPVLSLTDPSGNLILSEVALNESFTYLGLEPVIVDGQTTGVVFIGHAAESGGLRIWTWDFDTPPANFSATRGIDFVDFAVHSTAEGTKVFVLGTVYETERARIWEFDATTGERSSFALISGFDPQFLEIAPARDGNVAEVAVLGTVTETSGVRAFFFDAETKARTGTISFGRVDITDFAIRDDGTTGERHFIALRDNSNTQYVRADVRDRDGTRIELISFENVDRAQGIEVSDSSDLVIVTESTVGNHISVHTVEAGSNDLRSSNFGAGFAYQDYTTATFGDEIGVAIAQLQSTFGAQQVKTKLPDVNARIGTMAIAQADDPNAWFTRSLTQGHTRAWAAPPDREDAPFGTFLDTDIYDRTGEYFHTLGAEVFTRHAVSFDEDPWWPSETTLDENGEQRFRQARENAGSTLEADENPLQTSITNAWAFNTPLLAYYADSGDATIAAEHPEWVAKDSDGDPISHATKGLFLDITGPYGEIVKQRLLELADMGVSGIYLDFRHLPPGGIWGTSVEADYLAETGRIAPDNLRGDDYEDYLLFIQDRLTETMEGWRDALKDEYPHLQLIISVTTVPALTRLDMGVDLAGVASPKSEFTVAINRGQSNSVHLNNPDLYAPEEDVRQAFGWALLRDAAVNGKPHIWDSWSPNGDHEQAFVAAVTTYGGIAAVDVLETQLAPGNEVPGIHTRAELEEVFELGKTISPHLGDAEPLGATAVLWNDEARDALFSERDVAIWEEVNLPAIGGFEAYESLGQSPLVLTGETLKNDIPESVRTIYAPNTDALSAEQLASLSRFEARGGVIVSGDPDADWSTEEGYQSALSELMQTLSDAPQSPVAISGLPEKTHGVVYKKSNEGSEDTVVVAIANDFTFHQRSRFFDPVAEEDINPTPSDIPAGVSIQIDADFYPDVPADEIHAYDAITGTVIDVIETPDGLALSLPEIARMAVIVIDVLSSEN